MQTQADSFTVIRTSFLILEHVLHNIARKREISMGTGFKHSGYILFMNLHGKSSVSAREFQLIDGPPAGMDGIDRDQPAVGRPARMKVAANVRRAVQRLLVPEVSERAAFAGHGRRTPRIQILFRASWRRSAPRAASVPRSGAKSFCPNKIEAGYRPDRNRPD